MKRVFILFIIFTTILQATPSPPPHEGLWLPLFIKDFNYNEMKRAGLKLSADQLYSINQPCIKDAVVAIGDGEGSGSIISDKGLLLTTYHATYHFISNISTPEHNYIKDGFWATHEKEEIPCTGMKVTFLIQMFDVTDDILGTIPERIPETKRAELIAKKIQKIILKYSDHSKYEVKIESFCYGNQYFLFVYQVFTDVRLVGTPPSDITQFGGEEERWSWPRHNADFAIFRVYTAPDGSPAPYDSLNIPLIPKYVLPINIQGTTLDDFTMVWGYPQESKRFISSFEIKYWTDTYAKAFVEASTPFLPHLRSAIAAQDKTKLYYGDFFNVLTNHYLRNKGEMDNIFALDILSEIESRETKMKRWIHTQDEQYEQFNTLFSQLDTTFKQIDPDLIRCFWYGNITLQSSKMLMLPYLIENFSPTVRTEEEIEKIMQFYKSWIVTIDKDLEIKLIQSSFALWSKIPESLRPNITPYTTKYFNNDYKAFAEAVLNKSIFSSEERLKKFLLHPKVSVYQQDPLMRYYHELMKMIKYGETKISDFEKSIVPLQRDYALALLQMNTKDDKRHYPEANNSLRVSFGNIAGYQPADAVTYNYYTNHIGVLKKSKGKPSDSNYRIPEKLKRLLMDQDFSSYEQEGELRICFITDSDSGYGSIGSPILNGDGEIIGMMFDANKESLGNNFLYSKDIHRTVCLDSRYILFLIDKFADSSYLFEEMDIIQ